MYPFTDSIKLTDEFFAKIDEEWSDRYMSIGTRGDWESLGKPPVVLNRVDLELITRVVNAHFGAARGLVAIDVGCGCGRLLLALREVFNMVVGLEVSWEGYQRARILERPGLSVRRWDSYNYVLSGDVIIASNLFVCDGLLAFIERTLVTDGIALVRCAGHIPPLLKTNAYRICKDCLNLDWYVYVKRV